MSYLTATEAARLVSRESAERILAAVRTRFAGYLDPETDNGPTLYEPGFHTSSWSIGWEGAAYDWPTLFTAGGMDEDLYNLAADVTDLDTARTLARVAGYDRALTPDLFLEPVNSWCLGIYPADW